MRKKHFFVGMGMVLVLIFGLFVMLPREEEHSEQTREQEVSPQGFEREQAPQSSAQPGLLYDSGGVPLANTAQEAYFKLLRASAAHGYELLALEVDKPRQEPFRFGMGVTGNNLVVAFWKEQKKETGRDPLDILHALLGGVPLRNGTRYIWPRWSEKKLTTLTIEEQDEAAVFTGVNFKDLLGEGDYYGGPRTALGRDGTWLYFIEGN